MLLLVVTFLDSASRPAKAREGKRPPLPPISTNIDKLKERSSTEKHHDQLAEMHFSRPVSPAKPSRFGLYSRQRQSAIGIHQRLLAEEPSVNQLNSKSVFDWLHDGNQFVNFLLVATILRQLVDTLVDQRSSSKADVPTGSSSPTKGSHDKDKGQVPENSGSEQYIPESSSDTKGEKKSADDGTFKRESPVWIEFEQWLGSWVEVAKGDQFVATHNFNFHTCKVNRGEVGSVVELEMKKSVVPEESVTKSVILKFPTDSLISGWDFSEPVEEIDATRPTPFPISPFLLLPKKVSVSDFKWDGNNPVERLVREGIHPFRDPN